MNTRKIFKKVNFILTFLLPITYVANSQTVVDAATALSPMNNHGSWLKFATGGDPTSIVEEWGLNLLGTDRQPIKIPNASLMVGYTSVNVDHGLGNAFINGKLGVGTTSPNAKLHIKGTAVFSGNEANIDPAIQERNISFLENIGQMIIGWNRTAGGERPI